MNWTECIYEYDGSYHGLLCCVFDSYTRKERPIAISITGDTQTSLYPVHFVQTDILHARRILKSLSLKSSKAASLVKQSYLTCLPEKELLIYHFICKLYDEGPDFVKNPTDPALYLLHTAIRHMSGELEKLRGFIRFSEFNGFYAAEIEPKNRVLPALRNHFCSRFADQPFLIYDRTHKEALLYANGHWKITPLDSFEMAHPDKNEAQYRTLWKTFYDTIAIKERTNPHCQRTQMPLRYRNTMTEFQNTDYFIEQETQLTTAMPTPLTAGNKIS